jgi:hypothetical protein
LPVDYIMVDEAGDGGCMIAPSEGHALVKDVAWLMTSHAGHMVCERLGCKHHQPFADSEDFQMSVAVIHDLGESIEGQRLIAHAIRMTRITVDKLWPLIDSLAVELSEKKRLDGDYLQQRLVELVGPRPPLH